MLFKEYSIIIINIKQTNKQKNNLYSNKIQKTQHTTLLLLLLLNIINITQFTNKIIHGYQTKIKIKKKKNYSRIKLLIYSLE